MKDARRISNQKDNGKKRYEGTKGCSDRENKATFKC